MALCAEDRLILDVFQRTLQTLGTVYVPEVDEDIPFLVPDEVTLIEKHIIDISDNKLDFLVAQIHYHLENLQKPTDGESAQLSLIRELYLLKLFVKLLRTKWNSVKSAFRAIQGSVESESGKIRLREAEEKILPEPLDEKIATSMFQKFISYKGKANLVYPSEFERTIVDGVSVLSAFNYDFIIGNIIQHMLPHAQITEEEALFQISLIDALHMNQKRLVDIIAKVVKASSSQNVYKKTSVQVAIARALHKAIWNWIDNYPIEFIFFCQNGVRMSGNPDTLFDIFENWSTNNTKKIRVFWPAQTMLLILCPDLLLKIGSSHSDQKTDPKKYQFFETLRKSLKGSKVQDAAALCYVDMCKASTFVSKTEVTPGVRYLVPSLELELTDKLFNPQHPFKDADGAVDEALMVDCLFSFFLISPRKVILSLFPICLDGDSPTFFRRVLVKTVMRIAKESNLPWNPTIQDVYAGHSANLRNLFQEVKDSGRTISQLIASGKKVEKQVEKIQIDYDVLMDLVELFRVDPHLPLYFTKEEKNVELEQVKTLMTGLCECCTDFTLPDLAKSAADTLLVLHHPDNIKRWSTTSPRKVFWSVSSAVISKLTHVLIEQQDMAMENIESMIDLLEKILTYRIQFLESHHKNQPDRVSKSLRSQASVGLEISLLILLCSGNVQLVSHSAVCFGLACQEIDLVREFIDESDNVLVANYDAYKRFGAVGSKATGRQAQQKAIRTILRLVETQTTGNFSAWAEVLNRFQVHTRAVIRNEEIAAEPKKEEEEKSQSKPDKVKRVGVRGKVKGEVKSKVKGVTQIKGTLRDEEKERSSGIPQVLLQKKPAEVLQEWTNHLGFLCAMAAVPIGSPGSEGGGDMKKSKADLFEKKAQVVEDFLEKLMGLLSSEFINVRETVKKTLGDAIAPAALGYTFTHLYKSISRIVGEGAQPDFSDEALLSVDQVISVMKLIMDQELKDLKSFSNCESIILSLVKYLRQLTISISSLQSKHKLCGLIASIMAKSQLISWKAEYAFRTELVENLIEWTSEFSTKEGNIPADTPAPIVKQLQKIIKELDVQSMQAISALLKNLPLNGKDDEAKSELFSKLFSFFTNLLTRCKKNPSSVITPQMPEATIESISYLVTANIEHGLEYFVTMGYHEDYDTRSAFLKVLTNILKEGTEFSIAGDDEDKYYKLTELIMQDPLDIVLTLGSVTQATEADLVASILVRIFETHGKTLDLIRTAIQSEVRKTEKQNTLFRLNSIATKLLTQYCKLIGLEYLRTVLGPEVKHLITGQVSMEVDPVKMSPGQNLEENQALLRESGTRFWEHIKSTIDSCPVVLREICCILKETVGEKFPGTGAEYTAVAGFIFLRFLCPAIIAPDGFQVVTTKIPEGDARRSLLLTTKLIQNLANLAKFEKEEFMTPFNSFVEDHKAEMKAVLDTYATMPEVGHEHPPLQLTDEEREEDMGRLHYFLNLSLDKIGKAFEGKAPEKGQTSSFEKLTGILAQLGPPPELTTKGSATIARLGGTSKANVLFEEFMKKHASTDVAYLKAKNIFYPQGTTKKGVPVLYLAARNIKHDMDMETLIYYILKTTQPFFSKRYAILLDLTMFGAENQIAYQWWGTSYKMMPDQASENLDAVYVLHANQFFKKYSKRLAKFTGKINKKMELFSSVKDLLALLNEQDHPLADTLSMERDIQSTFSPVVQSTQSGKKVEVEIRLSKEFIQIQTLKPFPIFSQQTNLVTFIPISRVKNVEANKDTEVILTYENNGTNEMSLVSRNAGQLLQQLKASKDRYNLSRPQHTSRSNAFRPSDVPGTLLNMALLNLTSSNHTLRVAAYNLLSSLCQSFSFSLQETTLLGANDIAIGRNCIYFVERVSQDLAFAEPRLTLEFLMDALHGIIKADKISQIYVLDYIRPWMLNLNRYSIVSAEDSAEKREKVKELMNSLIALTIREARDLLPEVLSKIWHTVATLSLDVIEICINCLFERASPSSSTSPLGTKNMDCLEDIMICLASKHSQLIGGKIISALLQCLDDTINSPSDRLEAHSNWVKIEVLLRWTMTLAFNNFLHIEQWLPELCFIILMTFQSGDSMLRANIHALFMTVAHSVFANKICHENKIQTLRFHMTEFQTLTTRLHFGVGGTKTNFSIYQSAMNRDNKLEKKMPIQLVENVASYVMLLMNCCTPNITCVGSAYHSRLLSLIAKASLQQNPALQPRAICALGILEENSDLVTEDYVERLLMLLRSALHSYQGSCGDLEMAIILCLSKIFPHLSPTSKYYRSIFWIAVALLHIHDTNFYSATLSLMDSVLKALHDRGFLRADGLQGFCLNSRKNSPIGGLMEKLDSITGISFESNFSIALSCHLMKGLRMAACKSLTTRVIQSLVDLSSEKSGANTLGYFIILLACKFDEIESIQNIIANLSGENANSNILFNRTMVPDDKHAALAFMLLTTVLRSSDNEHEQILLFRLLDEGVRYNSAPFAVTFDSLTPKISHTIMNAANGEMLELVHRVSNFVFSSTLDSYISKYDLTYLKRIGFTGLLDCDVFHPTKKGALTQILTSILDSCIGINIE